MQQTQKVIRTIDTAGEECIINFTAQAMIKWIIIAQYNDLD